MDDFTCTLAIIVRNELPGSRDLHPRIDWNAFQQVLVIDGHSIDGTREFYESQNLRVITQSAVGLGAAMLEARAHCETEAIVFFHPDGNERPNDVLEIRRLLASGHEFVVGTRMVHGSRNEEDGQLLRPRKWANQVIAACANLLWASDGNRTTDATNGLRGIRCATWDRLNLDAHDCSMDLQMVIRALKNRVPITEIPVLEDPRLNGETHFGAISTGFAELNLMLRELVS